VIREDADAAELSFRCLPAAGGEAPAVTVRAEGFPDAVATPTRDPSGVWRADVDLQPGATLRARVTPPEGGRYFLRLEWWDGRRWISLLDHPGYRAGRVAVDGVHTFGGLAPGRYRLTEHYTQQSSDPVELRAGVGVDVTFDLAGTILVRGRVEVPEGEEPAYVAVHVEGREYGAVSVANPVQVTPEGTFEFRATRGERLVLVGKHPLLAPSGAPVAFVAGTDQPVLRFVAGPQVVFRIDGSDLTTAQPNPNISPTWWSPVRVRFWKADEVDGDGTSRPTIARDGRFRAASPGPGTWALQIEQPGFAPIVLDFVDLGSGVTDLGTLRQSEGATLTVRLHPGEKGLPSNVRVQAELQGPRAYSVWGGELTAGEPPTVTLKGLGPGRFRVVVLEGFGQETPLAEAAIESAGTGSLAVDLNLK
jgi:hypothetical protein